MINFHFLNKLYLGKCLSFRELEERRLAHINKQLVLWGYFTSIDNGTLLSLNNKLTRLTFKGPNSLLNFVKQCSNSKDSYFRYIAFTSKERAEYFLRSLDIAEGEQLLAKRRDRSLYYTEVYD